MEEITVSAERKLRILIAEDNRISGMILNAMLIDLGCAVYWARDGAEAMQVAQSDRFDLAIIDLRMPVMDGLTFAHQYRSIEQRARPMPIVALTAQDTHDIRDLCEQAGMDRFLQKPVNREQLISIFEEHLI